MRTKSNAMPGMASAKEQQEIYDSLKELVGMGLAVERDGRFFLAEGVKIVSVEEDDPALH